MRRTMLQLLCLFFLVAPLSIVTNPSQAVARQVKYRVTKAGANKVIIFGEHLKCRFHTSPDLRPYIQSGVKPGDRHIIHRGQWVTCLIDGHWSRILEADNR